MDDNELYRRLGALTRKKEAWKESVPYVGTLLEGQSPRVTAKALWLLGEMGLQYPDEIEPYVAKIASFLDSREELLRERALNALGRIGRARFEAVRPWWEKMFMLAADASSHVKLAFIWASENIATNTPGMYEHYLQPFAVLLHDSDDRVRMEAPEMFRVLGKRFPQMVEPYWDILQWLAENDPHPVVRIHCAGAIRITKKALGATKRSVAR